MRNQIFILFLIAISGGNLLAQTHYPMEIGNLWSYDIFVFNDPYPSYNYTKNIEIVSDTLMPNGKVYYVLNDYDVIRGKYLRADSSFVYYFSEFDTSEVAMFNLLSMPGETDSVYWPPVSEVILEEIDTINIFGATTIVRKYHLTGLITYHMWLSDLFGPIYGDDLDDANTPFYYWYLTGCLISDTLYGVINDINEETKIPPGFNLYQNYPNPFNPTTTIRYALPKTSEVKIEIFDIMGKKIITLFEGKQNPGTYTIDFEASNLASGIYLYKIQAGDLKYIKKMVLMK